MNYGGTMSDKFLGKNRFRRTFNPKLQNALKATELYEQELSSDISKGLVFPAFRNKVIDFYYKGGKLFEFKGKFATHVKYASVLHGYNKDYISDEDLQGGVRLISNFTEGYKRIKENCALYAGVESSGVSKIYEKSGYLHPGEDIVVLDIEVSLQALDTGWENEVVENEAIRVQDRIDLLLYNKKTKTLCFFEAKHFSNKELWSEADTKPKVVNQLKRYNSQLIDRNDEILDSYKEYIATARQLFNIPVNILPDPVAIEEEVVLLVFGFDNDQKKKLEKLLIKDSSLDSIKYRFIGNPKNASDLWKNIKRGIGKKEN
jgi:hypothetical protein